MSHTSHGNYQASQSSANGGRRPYDSYKPGSRDDGDTHGAPQPIALQNDAITGAVVTHLMSSFATITEANAKLHTTVQALQEELSQYKMRVAGLEEHLTNLQSAHNRVDDDVGSVTTDVRNMDAVFGSEITRLETRIDAVHDTMLKSMPTLPLWARLSPSQ